VPVSVCGEVAAVPAVKAAVRTLDLRDCVDLAKRSLGATSAAEVRRLAAEFAQPTRRET
jgi:phosphoenolpyruvate-protein kinase (PTS system EI component)